MSTKEKYQTFAIFCVFCSLAILIGLAFYIHWALAAFVVMLILWRFAQCAKECAEEYKEDEE